MYIFLAYVNWFNHQHHYLPMAGIVEGNNKIGTEIKL